MPKLAESTVQDILKHPCMSRLIASIQKDCKEGRNCFNPMGCDREGCMHTYCDKLQWILRRANQYAEFTGLSITDVLAEWEKDRTYWYMNYYQEANQPPLDTFRNAELRILKKEEWVKEATELFGKDSKDWKFVCPACGHIQSGKMFEDNGIEGGTPYFNCMGRYKDGEGCKYTLGGLFTLNKTAVVDSARIVPVFEFAKEPA